MRVLVDVRDTKDGKKMLAVLNQKERTGGASERVVSRHTSNAAAERARLKTPHGRVVTLIRDLPVGSLVFGPDIQPDRNARWS